MFSSHPAPLWRSLLRNNFVHWEKLADFLELDQNQRLPILKKSHFPLNLPLRLAQKIKKGTLNDPILRQFLPTESEQRILPHFIKDPVGDQTSRKTPKLLHKYEERVLLLCTSACAMHCRFCFRQNFDYATKEQGFSQELQLIKEDPSIKEVILSGGDPLSLSDHELNHLLQQLAATPHVKRLRFHTRFPIGIPERIDSNFLALFSSIPLQIWFVIHANHPSELDEDIFAALRQLQRLGVGLLCQSVLLKGVNDNADILIELCQKLVDHGILPYYLHQLDRTTGLAHFEVSEDLGLSLIREISKKLSGYAVPKYVREIAGEPSKTPF